MGQVSSHLSRLEADNLLHSYRSRKEILNEKDFCLEAVSNLKSIRPPIEQVTAESIIYLRADSLHVQ